jgi:phytol kinase
MLFLQRKRRLCLHLQFVVAIVVLNVVASAFGSIASSSSATVVAQARSISIASSPILLFQQMNPQDDKPTNKLNFDDTPSSKMNTAMQRFKTEDNTSIVANNNDDNDDDDDDTLQKSSKVLIINVLLGATATVTAAAKFGVLKGPLLALDAATTAESFGVYTDAMILRDFGSTIVSAALAYAFVKSITWSKSQDFMDAKVARKLIHVLSAPLFILVWPLFSPAQDARFFAGIITLVNGLRLYRAGTGTGDASLAGAVSRSGDKKEALEGPFIYVCIMQVMIWFFWRSSMVGVVALSTMAAGDGMADLVGRKWGRQSKWFFSEDKSVVGSVAFAVASSISSIGLVTWLITTGCLQSTLLWTDLAFRITGISLTCAVVELLPIGDDNYTVPLSAAILAYLFLS